MCSFLMMIGWGSTECETQYNRNNMKIIDYVTGVASNRNKIAATTIQTIPPQQSNIIELIVIVLTNRINMKQIIHCHLPIKFL